MQTATMLATIVMICVMCSLRVGGGVGLRIPLTTFWMGSGLANGANTPSPENKNYSFYQNTRYPFMQCPSSTMEAPSASSSPATRFRRVDLPTPDSPITAT